MKKNKKHSEAASLANSRLLELAVEHHQNGRFEEAQSLYQQLLKIEPKNSEALHFSGILAAQLGNHSLAIQQLTQAVYLSNSAQIHFNLANTLLAIGRNTEAILHYQQTLQLEPDFIEALTQLAQLYFQQKNYLAAIELYKKTLALQTNNAPIQNDLANTYLANNQWQEAATAYQQLLLIQPENAQTYHYLSYALLRQKQFPAALEFAQKALALMPDYCEAQLNLASILYEQHRFEEAAGSCLQALKLNPHYPIIHNKLAAILNKQGKTQEAITYYHQAIALNPQYAEAYNNLAHTLWRQNRLKEAAEYCRQAIASSETVFADAYFNLGTYLLSVGNYTEGWQYLEYRYHPLKTDFAKNIILPNLNFPQWQGQSLRNKAILIWPEQGFGDEIQFSRFLVNLKKLGARSITLVCRSPLKTLLQTVAGATQVLERSETMVLSEYDYWTYTFSIPLYCKITPKNIPSPVPYLYADSQLIQEIALSLQNINDFKIGLCWQGNPNHIDDANRSPGIAVFHKVFQMSGVKFFTLQPQTRIELLQAAGDNGVDRGHEIDSSSFAEAAALIMNLDLIISCDTSIAHLAGALGKPVWIVLPFVADWRWLTDRDDSPWYPTAKLFRQKQAGNWTEVFERVEAELKTVMANKTSRISWISRIGRIFNLNS